MQTELQTPVHVYWEEG